MEQSGGRSRFLCWELVGLICFAGGDTSKQGKSREIKGNRGNRGNQGKQGNQGKSREIKGNQGKSREVKGSQGKSRETGESKVR